MNKNKSFAFLVIAALVVVAFLKLSAESEYAEQLKPLIDLKNDLAQCPKPDDKNCVEQCAKMTNFEELAELANTYAVAKVHIDQYYKDNPPQPAGYYSPTEPSRDLLADALVYLSDPGYFVKTNKAGVKNVKKFLELIEEQSKNYQAGRVVTERRFEESSEAEQPENVTEDVVTEPAAPAPQDATATDAVPAPAPTPQGSGANQ